MSFLDLCTLRRSCRGFSPEPVEQEKIDYILQCARLAPSATNRQPWHIYVVTSPEARAKVAESYGRPWFAEAPLMMVVCSLPDSAWVRPADSHNHSDIDAAILAEHITLAATDCGLGSCWVCNFDPAKMREALQLPAEQAPVVVFPIGYHAPHTPRDTTRKPIEEIASFL